MRSEELAWKIRRHGIEMTHLSGGSHIGAILSVADILAVLYTDILKYDPKNPEWEDRDRMILSKGHAGASIYAALAENGFFPVEELKTHYQDGSRLSGHVSHHLPGVDFSTGSLGHGLSAAAGMAYALKKDGKTPRVFVVLGDGECDEGSVWEAALFANHFRLNNLVAVVDHNHMQSMDFCENTLELEDFGAKWRAFGWNVIEVNGNSHEELKRAFAEAEECREAAESGTVTAGSVASGAEAAAATTAGASSEPAAAGNAEAAAHKPTVIIADTVKGYGVSFMENDILWHYRFPHDGWEYDCAVNELHRIRPEGVEDPYTPDGIKDPQLPQEGDDIGNDHTYSYTWFPGYPEKMRRAEARSGSDEKVRPV